MNPEQLTGQTTSHLVTVTVGQKDFLIHPEVAEDLLALKKAADKAGFNFNIASGFRDFERQLQIWNRKFSGETPIMSQDSQPLDRAALSDEQAVFAILRWSALPGGSRHHWGTDFDVFDRHSLPEGSRLKLEPWEYLSGHQSEFYLWLKAHLPAFGFFFPYDQDYGGVAPEPWHISHRRISQACLSHFSAETLAAQLDHHPILGKEQVQSHLTKIYTQYITNISSAGLIAHSSSGTSAGTSSGTSTGTAKG